MRRLGHTAGANGSLPPGLRLVNDKSNRVMAYDDDSTDPWTRQYGVGILTWDEDGVITWIAIQDDDYLRRGIGTAMLEYARTHVRSDIRHSTELSDSGAAWARATGSRTASAGKLYRGVRVDLDPSLLAKLADPVDVVDVGRELEIGPIILDRLASYGGLGTHWSTRPEIAERFALNSSGNGSGVGVLLTADWSGQGEDRDRTGVGGLGDNPWADEAEITLLPGTPLTIVSVVIGSSFRDGVEVLHTDKYARHAPAFAEHGLSVPTGGPQFRTAEIVDHRPDWDPEVMALLDRLHEISDEGLRPQRMRERNNEARAIVQRLRALGFDSSLMATAGARTASTGLIARGIGYVQLPDIETCRKFAEGRFTAQDVVDLVLMNNNGRAGVWWGSIGNNEWDYYDDEYAPFHHAYYSSNSDPMTIVAEYDEAAEEYGDQVFYSEKADIGVVLYAEHPYVNGTYWNPLTDNQPIPGHQSQSYVPEGTQLRLVKVGVEHAGLVDEIYLPAHGMTVTAALGGQGLTVTAAGKCEYCKEQATQKIIHSEGMAYIPVCDSHLSKGKDDAAACVPYGDPDPSNVDRVEKISAYYTEDELRALGEQAMAEDPRLRQLAEQWEARQAGWENDFDEIVDLLGGPLRPAEPWVAPERPHFDPIPGVEPGWEEYALDLLGRPDRTGEADLWLPTEVAWYYREYDRSGNSGQASAVEYVLRQEGIRSPVTVSTDGRQALMIEGNHRVMIARRLGIAQIPVRIQWDPNGVRANEGTPKPLEPVLEDWLRQRGRIARAGLRRR